MNILQHSPLLIDTKEPFEVRGKFYSMAQDRADLEIKFVHLLTGDFLTNYFVLERKTLDDFISSFTTRTKRKSGKVYNRLKEQTDRMAKMPQPIKTFLIIGEDYSKAYANVGEASFNAQVAKIQTQGINVIMMHEKSNWPDYIYRLYRMTNKYPPKPMTYDYWKMQNVE